MDNPPGRSALAYRSGTHGTVLRRMLAALPNELGELTVRTSDDPAVALLDAWAVVADVVTFYQERIANEGFLRTATETGSVRELARAIGYELHPGVAASTHLAFTVETAPESPASVVVAGGIRISSVPGQGELPQTFETGEQITAEAARNELRPRRRRPQVIRLGMTRLYLAGVDTGLRPGDAILVVGDERKQAGGNEQWDFRILRTVEPIPARTAGEPSVTLVGWDVGIGMDRDRPVEPARDNVEVYAFRLRTALFGHHAPPWRTMPDEVRKRYAGADAATATQWPGYALPGPGEEPVIDVDGAHPDLGAGSWLVLKRPGYRELYRVERAELSAREDFGISGKTTRVWLDAEEHLSWFGIRATAVYTQTERLTVAEEPIDGEVAGRELELDRPAPLAPGMPLIVTGADVDGAGVAEVVRIDAVGQVAGVTTVRLVAPLSRPLRRDSVRILGNVVAATHGETVADQVLGGGDGARTHQRFPLRNRQDLTHVSAPTPRGVAGTVEVRVDGVAWTPYPSLFAAGPHDRAYLVRIDDGEATVVFGDGVRGARLPTGQENVRASYRTGIGPAGNVRAGALSLLSQRPLGISAVTNPLAATGGTAPEDLRDARVNASLTVLTLDRVVSLRDHEDFARGFGGIAKARAVALWDGSARLVHVTVAAPGGATVDISTLDNLRAAFDAVRDPTHRVRIENYHRLSFTVAVDVLPDPAYQDTAVREEVGRALRAAFAFDARAFGQPVTAAEVLTVVQRVPGVVAANPTRLHLVGAPAQVQPVIAARDARAGAPAELLLVDPDGIEVSGMAP
jgi:predicted phage baseplate assembly protein